MSSTPAMDGPARLGYDRATGAFVCLCGLVLGALAGWLIPMAVDWADGRDWPVPGVVRIVTSFDSAWLVWGRPIIGALLGLVAGLVLVHRSPTLLVDPEKIVVVRGDDRRRIMRDQVAGVFRERGKVVIHSVEGRVLFDDEVESTRAVVRDAFVSSGYPWESE